MLVELHFIKEILINFVNLLFLNPNPVFYEFANKFLTINEVNLLFASV